MKFVPDRACYTVGRGLSLGHLESKVTHVGMMPGSLSRGRLAAWADASGSGGEMSRFRPDNRKLVKVSYRAVDLIASMIGGLAAGLIFNRAWGVIEH